MAKWERTFIAPWTAKQASQTVLGGLERLLDGAHGSNNRIDDAYPRYEGMDGLDRASGVLPVSVMAGMGNEGNETLSA